MRVGAGAVRCSRVAGFVALRYRVVIMEAHHDVTGIAVVALAAMACGILLARLRQPAILGYIIAGVILGPSVLGLVTDRGSIGLLAELGIIMLLFVIGSELSVQRFAEVWRVALITTLSQIGGSVGLMLLLREVMGWSLGLAILLGYAVALSSTAVVIKILQDSGEAQSRTGRLAVGILIAQDMAVVPMLLSLSAVAGDTVDLWQAAKGGLSIVVLAGLVLLLLKREIRLPYAGLVAGHADLAPLAGFAYCFGAAALAGVAGLSPGYGAFLIGLIIGNAREGHKLAKHAHSIQSVLLMVFFLSVGLLLDLSFLWANLDTVLVILAAVLLFKSALNMVALHLQRVPWAEAFVAAVALGQMGEFSFLFVGAGMSMGILAEREGQLVIAVTVLSLMVSPLWLATARRLGTVRSRTAKGSLGEALGMIYEPETDRVTQAWQYARAVARRLRSRGRALPNRKQKGPEDA